MHDQVVNAMHVQVVTAMHNQVVARAALSTGL